MIQTSVMDTETEPMDVKVADMGNCDGDSVSLKMEPSDTTQQHQGLNGGQSTRNCSATVQRSPLAAQNHKALSNQRVGGMIHHGGSEPVKKLVIANFRSPKNLPENIYNDAWASLREAVLAIQGRLRVSTSLELLYKSVESLVASKPHAARLYQDLELLIGNHVQVALDGLRPQPDGVPLLKALERAWRDHCQQMNAIRSIFLTLDRKYVLQTTALLQIWDLGLDKFRNSLVISPAEGGKSLEWRLVTSVLEQVEKERAGEEVDRPLLRSTLRMLVDMSIYERGFAVRFLDMSSSYYRSEGQLKSVELDPTEYLRHVERRFKEEEDRVLHYIDVTSRSKLIEILERELVGSHLPLILQRGFSSLMDEDRRPELALIFQLAGRVPEGASLVCNTWNAYIKEKGKAIVSRTDPNEEQNMIEEIMEYKAKLNDILMDCFDKSPKFANALREAFESFLNIRANKTAELIAKFLDKKLKEGNRVATEEELERVLERVLVLFRFMHGKDVFEAFYKKDLAKRLLLGKSASVDAEKSMLSKLKVECGSGFTSKLEGMFKDIELSKELQQPFKVFLSSKAGKKSAGAGKELPDIDFNVSVLTLSYWPSYPPQEISLPTGMVSLQSAFQTFYLSKHSGRKLQWQPNLGHCVVKAFFGAEKNVAKEFQVSLYQALVLLQFNEHESRTTHEIQQDTRMDKDELQRTLQSLACGKVRTLKKSPAGKDVAETDTFSVNLDFKHPLYRIKINQVQLRETVSCKTASV